MGIIIQIDELIFDRGLGQPSTSSDLTTFHHTKPYKTIESQEKQHKKPYKQPAQVLKKADFEADSAYPGDGNFDEFGLRNPR